MKILIFGGTGVLSYDFTKKAIDEGNEVTIVNRGKKNNDFNDKANCIFADIRNENIDKLRETICITKYDLVVDYLSYDKNHVAKMLDVIDGYYGCYVFISTAMIYKAKEDGSSISEEDATVYGKWDYADKKSDAESYLKSRINNYIIIRPYITYGKTRIPFQMAPDQYYYTLIKRIKDKMPIPLYNEGNMKCNITSTLDFAEVFYRLINEKTAIGNSYNIVNSTVLTWKEVYLTVCNELGVEPNYYNITDSQVNKYLPEYYDSLKCGKGIDYYFDNKKVIDTIGGYSFKINIQDGIKRSIEYYMQNEKAQGIDYRWDGRMDYAYKKVTGKICKKTPCEGNVEKSTNKSSYYFMQTKIGRVLYKYLKKNAYE